MRLIVRYEFIVYNVVEVFFKLRPLYLTLNSDLSCVVFSIPTRVAVARIPNETLI